MGGEQTEGGMRDGKDGCGGLLTGKAGLLEASYAKGRVEGKGQGDGRGMLTKGRKAGQVLWRLCASLSSVPAACVISSPQHATPSPSSPLHNTNTALPTSALHSIVQT